MRVIDLRTILKHLPDDLEVVIEPGRGFGTCHVAKVHRRGSLKVDHVQPHSRYGPGEHTAGAVHLAPSSVGWWAPPPPFEVTGRLRDPVGLWRRLRGIGAKVTRPGR